METKTLCNVGAVAEALGIARSQVYNLTKRGDIPVVMAGRHYRYDLNEVIAALKRPARVVREQNDELRQDSRCQPGSGYLRVKDCSR